MVYLSNVGHCNNLCSQVKPSKLVELLNAFRRFPSLLVFDGLLKWHCNHQNCCRNLACTGWIVFVKSIWYSPKTFWCSHLLYSCRIDVNCVIYWKQQTAVNMLSSITDKVARLQQKHKSTRFFITLKRMVMFYLSTGVVFASYLMNYYDVKLMVW